MGKSNHSILWPLVGGACLLLALLACGVFTVFGAGAALLAARLNAREPVSPQVVLPEKLPDQAKMPDQPIDQAVLQDLRGVVEVQAKDGLWTAAAEGQLVEAGQRVRTGRLSGVALAFPDGSRAGLLADAEISIDKLAVSSEGRESIVLTQWTGESDHEVAPGQGVDSRYQVNTPAGTGEAQGTAFHVIVMPAQASSFYVIEGVVIVTGAGVSVPVSAGQITIIVVGEPPLDPVLYVTGEGVVSQTGPTWIINNQEFLVTEDTIIIGDPEVGDWVAVRGRLLEDGSKVADWIVLLRPAHANHFTLTGKVDEMAADQWIVNGQVVALTDQTEITDGIEVGDIVRVEGQVLAGGVLEAARIEKVDEALGLPFDFTGVVESTGEVWVISGVEVATNAETDLPDKVEVGALARAQGWIQPDGTWLAVSITLVEETQGSFCFTGILEDMDPWKVAGISFETRDWTEIDDDLDVGDLVRVEGQIDEKGLWIASEIEKVEVGVSSLVLFGPVISIDPWVVGGIPLPVTDETIIDGEVSVGMLVRVEILIQTDGSWLVMRITPLPPVVWFPGCIEVIARVVEVDEGILVLEGWPDLSLDDEVEIEGDVEPGSLVRVLICFSDDMTLHIVYIIIIVEDEDSQPDSGNEGGQVTVCHKPGKKGGHTLTISRSALGAHLGHGDYEGACR